MFLVRISHLHRDFHSPPLHATPPTRKPSVVWKMSWKFFITFLLSSLFNNFSVLFFGGIIFLNSFFRRAEKYYSKSETKASWAHVEQRETHLFLWIFIRSATSFIYHNENGVEFEVRDIFTLFFLKNTQKWRRTFMDMKSIVVVYMNTIIITEKHSYIFLFSYENYTRIIFHFELVIFSDSNWT